MMGFSEAGWLVIGVISGFDSVKNDMVALLNSGLKCACLFLTAVICLEISGVCASAVWGAV
jgi:hypothetical protein